MTSLVAEKTVTYLEIKSYLKSNLRTGPYILLSFAFCELSLSIQYDPLGIIISSFLVLGLKKCLCYCRNCLNIQKD